MFLTGCYLKSYLTMNLPFVFSSFTKGTRRVLSEDAETIVAHLRLLSQGMERYDFDISRLRLRDPVAIFTLGYNPFEGQPVEVDGKLLKPGRLFQALAKTDQGVADAYEAAFEQGHRLWMFNPDIVSMVGESHCWDTAVGLLMVRNIMDEIQVR